MYCGTILVGEKGIRVEEAGGGKKEEEGEIRKNEK